METVAVVPCFPDCTRCARALALLGPDSYNNWRSFHVPNEHLPGNELTVALSTFSTNELADELIKRLEASKLETEEVDTMVRIDGSAFRCDCGCNVFRRAKNDEALYVCNSCRSKWRGEK